MKKKRSRFKNFLDSIVKGGFGNYIQFFKEFGILLAVLISLFVLFVYLLNKLSSSY